MSADTTPSFEDDQYNAVFGLLTNLGDNDDDDDDDDDENGSNGGVRADPTVTTTTECVAANAAVAPEEVGAPRAPSEISPSTTHPTGGSSTSYLLSPVNTNSPSPPTMHHAHDDVRARPDRDGAGGGIDAISPTDFKPSLLDILGQNMQTRTPETRSGGASANGGSSLLRRSLSTENYGRPVIRIHAQQSPSPMPIQRIRSNPGPDKRSRPEPLSPRHLSPPVDNYGYAMDDDATTTPDVLGTTRADDGSWVPDTATGQAGVDPNSRREFENMYVPSLKEQEQQRELDAKKVDVELWIVTSTASSVSGDRGGQSPRSPSRLSLSPAPRHTRPRSHSEGRVVRLRPDLVGPGLHDSDVPGPGVLVHEQSDDDDEDDDDGRSNARTMESSAAASWNYDDADYRSPVDASVTAGDDTGAGVAVHAHPWTDCPRVPTPGTNARAQPATANAAITRFRQRAENFETASRMATWGTRRMSESEVEKFVKEGVSFNRMSLDDKTKEKDSKAGQKTDKKKLWPFSTKVLRKRSIDKSPSELDWDQAHKFSPDASPGLVLIRTESGLSKPQRPSAGVALTSFHSSMAAVGGGGNVAKPAPQPASIRTQVINSLRRGRAKSDVSKKPEGKDADIVGLSSLIAQVGGPPVTTLGSSSPRETEAVMAGVGAAAAAAASAAAAVPHGSDEEEDDNDVDDEEAMEGEGVEMDLNVRSVPTMPDYDGFRQHVLQLNPRQVTFLVDRISHAQVERFKKLVEMRQKHQTAVGQGRCSSGNAKFCFQLGGEATTFPLKSTSRDPAVAFAGFQVAGPVSMLAEGGPDSRRDATVTPAQFPRGVPSPPVARLPAEFECPLCFKVKKFQKPSDWTKHVHEDVQPFTCTFPHCPEPRSFKRKADWVRHENERHRQLEWWTCNLPDCTHTCYRRDNFVQHLVREHKKAEPRMTKAHKAPSRSPAGHGFQANAAAAARDASPAETDQVLKLVEECRHETPKTSRDEPCKFCGNICSSWKKLTVHLARHLEQISLPVLKLVEQNFAGDASTTGTRTGTGTMGAAARLAERPSVMPPPATNSTLTSTPRLNTEVKMEPAQSRMTMTPLMNDMADMSTMHAYGFSDGNGSYATAGPSAPGYGYQSSAYDVNGSTLLSSPQQSLSSSMAGYAVSHPALANSIHNHPVYGGGGVNLGRPDRYGGGYQNMAYGNGMPMQPSTTHAPATREYHRMSVNVSGPPVPQSSTQQQVHHAHQLQQLQQLHPAATAAAPMNTSYQVQHAYLPGQSPAEQQYQYAFELADPKGMQYGRLPPDNDDDRSAGMAAALQHGQFSYQTPQRRQ